jgi:lipoyl(octanoyl) transferase
MTLKVPLSSNDVVVRELGHVEYLESWRAMQFFNQHRDPSTTDELWLLTHPAVYTVGLKGKDRTFVSAHGIPFVHSDRGGDITYHGPGQIIAYILMDLRRRRWGVKKLVHALEQSVIDLLARHHIAGVRRPGAPGVYVDGKKISALGLRVSRGLSTHGLALNIDMDLEPFSAIDPCGYPGLEVTQLSAQGIGMGVQHAMESLTEHLRQNLAYRTSRRIEHLAKATEQTAS